MRCHHLFLSLSASSNYHDRPSKWPAISPILLLIDSSACVSSSPSIHPILSCFCPFLLLLFLPPPRGAKHFTMPSFSLSLVSLFPSHVDKYALAQVQFDSETDCFLSNGNKNTSVSLGAITSALRTRKKCYVGK